MYANIIDFGATTTGDSTVAIQNAIVYAKTNKKTLLIPEGTFTVSGTLDVTGIDVEGLGRDSKIMATAAVFDVFRTEGNTRFSNFYIDGAWANNVPWTDPNASANSISIKNTSGSYPYHVRIENLIIQNSKQNGIYIERGGYSSIKSTKVNACGAHGCEMVGVSGSDAVTTISIEGFSVFSDCIGYGVRIQNGILITLNTVISEHTKGIELAGNDNRSINILNYYQENTSTGKFVTFTGAGMGVNMMGCFCGNHSIDYSSNFTGVNIIGNSLLQVPAVTDNWNVLQLGISRFGNISGVSPAHVFDTAPLSNGSEYKFIAELRNNNVPKAQFDAEGGLHIANGTWDGGHLILGNYHLWMFNNQLRIKNGKPASGSEGTLIVTVV